MIARVQTRTILGRTRWDTKVQATAGNDSITVPWDQTHTPETNHSTAAEVFAASYLGMPNARTDEAVKLGSGTWRVTVIDED